MKRLDGARPSYYFGVRFVRLLFIAILPAPAERNILL